MLNFLSTFTRKNNFAITGRLFITCSLTGLGYGVYTGSLGNTTAPFTVQRSDFVNCYVGIHNRRITGGTILFNNFNMGDLPSTEIDHDQIGILLTSTILDFEIQENDFLQKQPNENIRTIGISCFDLGPTDKRIRRNSFGGLNIGNQAGGGCGDEFGGLQYQCNFNSNNQE